MTKLRTLLFFSLLGCSSLSVAADAQTMAQATNAPTQWQMLAAELREFGEEAELPGMAIVIFDHGHPAVVSTTWAPSTPFRWGSITKTLTALTALSLSASGELALNEPVRSYLPRGVFSNPWAPTQPLRLRHLLEQSAGLPDLSAQEWDSNAPQTDLSAGPPRQLLWPPGLQHSYSNVTPGLTAAVIEAVSGKTFAQVLQQRVLLPLGMGQASLEPLPDLPGGFREDGTTAIPYWNMAFPAFGALNASVPEMTRFLSMLLQQGYHQGQRLFDAATINAMFSPGDTLGTRAGLQLGYGAGIYSWISQGHQFWGHGGDADGYLSRYGLLPRSGRGYLIAINVDRPALLRRLQRRLEAELTRDLPRPPLPEPVEPTSLDRFTGRYYPSAARFNVAAWQAGDTNSALIERQGALLRFIRGNRSTLLTPIGPSRFRRDQDPLITVIFAADDNGNLFLQGELGNFVKSDHCPGFIPNCHQ